jgi:hypothetical protein
MGWNDSNVAPNGAKIDGSYFILLGAQRERPGTMTLILPRASQYISQARILESILLRAAWPS